MCITIMPPLRRQRQNFSLSPSYMGNSRPVRNKKKETETETEKGAVQQQHPRARALGRWRQASLEAVPVPSTYTAHMGTHTNQYSSCSSPQPVTLVPEDQIPTLFTSGNIRHAQDT